jgi:lipopolysaccharide transport system permease protein
VTTVEPPSGLAARPLRELYRHRYLFVLWIGRELRVRYSQSLLGVSWAILQPLALALVFTVVFSRLLSVPTGATPYPLFVYSALLPWTLFTNALTSSTHSLLSNMNLVTKIFFPREILPLASVGAALADFLAASVVLAILMVRYDALPGAELWWVLPLLTVQLVLTAAVALASAAVMVFFRDLRFVVPLGLQIWMYACPIVYPVDLVPERWRPLYFLNPMAGLIDGWRRVLVSGAAPRAGALAAAAVVSSLSLLLAYVLFKRLEARFADVI